MVRCSCVHVYTCYVAGVSCENVSRNRSVMFHCPSFPHLAWVECISSCHVSQKLRCLFSVTLGACAPARAYGDMRPWEPGVLCTTPCILGKHLSHFRNPDARTRSTNSMDPGVLRCYPLLLDPVCQPFSSMKGFDQLRPRTFDLLPPSAFSCPWFGKIHASFSTHVWR